jgi:dTMP kinase
VYAHPNQAVRGIFICLEGLDGCGKSTQAKILANWLKSLDKGVILTAEPTKGPIGRFLRKIIQGRVEVAPLAEAMLFAADRCDHLEKLVKPALARGKVVVCERYIYSSLAYQGARGVPEQTIRKLNEQFLRPHLVILLDVPVDVALRRMKKRNLDEFEKNRPFQERVREIYLLLFKKEGLPILDGTLPVPELAEKIKRLVTPLLKE